MAWTAGLLAFTAWLPAPSRWLAALAAIIVLGIPHGALDGELARPLLRPRLGWAWFGAFAVPYLGLTALVLLAWRAAPLWALATFLAGSVWHFGAEDAAQEARPRMPGGRGARGGCRSPSRFCCTPRPRCAFSAPSRWCRLTRCRTGSLAARGFGAGVFALWLLQCIGRRRWARLAEPLALLLVFAALPPLTAFAIYFVGVHAPPPYAGHGARPPCAARRQPARGNWPLSLPLTALTLLIGAALWHCYPGGARRPVAGADPARLGGADFAAHVAPMP